MLLAATRSKAFNLAHVLEGQRVAWLTLCHCLVAKLCPTLCDPVTCSTPGFAALHYLPELTQTHVH